MCGRFTQEHSNADLADLFEAEPLTEDSGGRFNIAPTDPASVVVERHERRVLTTYRWGLVPHCAKDPSMGTRFINARAETLATSGAFRDLVARHRCLVPADGFYDGAATRAVASRSSSTHRTVSRSRSPACGRAGTTRTDQVLRTFTIVTARRTTSWPRCDRMPVDARDAWAMWRPDARGHRRTQPRPDADDGLEGYPVDTLVNNVRNDGPALIVRSLRRSRRPARRGRPPTISACSTASRPRAPRLTRISRAPGSPTRPHCATASRCSPRRGARSRWR
jgi:putative SOS response-associated peptidase YedK